MRIQKLNNEQKKGLLGNKKGMSLVELCVTIAIMATLIAVLIGSISVIFRARAKTAADKIGSTISQCKINSLSGIDNEFTLSYDTAERQYVCKLAKKGSSGSYSEVYKEEYLGNSRVSIFVGEKSVLDGAELKIRFSNNDGKVEIIEVTAEGATESLGTNLSNEITVSSARTYKITLYNLTGEHEIKVA